MPVNFIERCRIEKEDWEAAEEYVRGNARQLGLFYDRQISVITVTSSEEFWRGLGAQLVPNPDMITLSFHRHHDRHRKPASAYLYSIAFDTGTSAASSVPYVEWQMSETSGDPPESLKEFIERYGNDPSLKRRAAEHPGFFEIYEGIYSRLFPYLEHGDLHTDLGAYEEAKASSSHIKKEIWRTDLLTALQGMRFPKLEIEADSYGMSKPTEGMRVTWQPQGHTNYTIWFDLHVGNDPKVCAYIDPTLSGSTTGWLSTRLLKNENALEKLPYTVEQWAVEDMRRKTCPAYYRGVIRELLRHHIPRDMEEAWGAIRRQLVGLPHGDLHTAAGEYEESILQEEALMKRLKEGAEEEEEARYYGIATGDGNNGVSHMSPHYIVLTDKPWDLAKLAAHAMFEDDPVIQDWVRINMDIDGDEKYGIIVSFPESWEVQQEQQAAYEEYEKRREEAEAAGEEFEEDDPSEEYMESTWFIVEIFPIPASDIDGYRCEVYTDDDHPAFLEPLEPFVPPPVEHGDLHTAAGEFEEAFLAALSEQFRLKG